MGFLKYEEKQAISKGIEEAIQEKEINTENMEKFYADSDEMEVRSANFNCSQDYSEACTEKSTVLCEDKCEDKAFGNVMDCIDGDGNNTSSEIAKRGVVWWKMPVDFLKYCVFRVSPVWTVFMAAAVIGFVILGRRLYKMKKKTKGLEIKVTVDDKVREFFPLF